MPNLPRKRKVKKMNFNKENYKVERIVDDFQRGLIVRNLEYQRGLQWDVNQMKSLIPGMVDCQTTKLVFLRRGDFWLQRCIALQFHRIGKNSENNLRDIQPRQRCMSGLTSS